MAVLAIGAIGAAVGSAIGGTFIGMSAVALGWNVGLTVGGMLFGPKGQDIYQQGPRLGDLKVQSSTYGNPIPIVCGAMRIAGNVIWSANIVETAHTTTQSSGGKGGGGGGSVTQTSYSYSQSFAVGICAGEIAGIGKIWANGKLIYNLSDTADIATIVASNKSANGIRIYTGSETQAADSLIQASVGAADCPAYRGAAYMVFENLQLADYGNRMPNLEFEVVDNGSDDPVTTNYSTTATVVPDGVRGNTIFTSELSGSPYPYYVTRHRFNLNGGLIESKLAQFETGSAVRFVTLVKGGGAIYYVMDGYSGSRCYILNFEGAKVGDFLPADYGLSGGIDSSPSTSKTYYARATDTIYASFTQGILAINATTGAVISVFYGGLLPTAADDSGNLYRHSGSTISRLTANLSVAETFTITNDSTSAYTTFIGRDGDDWYFYNSYYSGSPRAWKITSSTTTIDVAARIEATLSSVLPELVYVGGGCVIGVKVSGTSLHAVSFNAVAGTNPALSTIVSDICTRAGLTAGQIDVTALTDTVHGYVVQRGTARSQIEQLMSAFYFDAVESDGKIKFVKRGGSVAVSIPEDDLAAHEYGSAPPDTLVTNRRQEMELPVELHVQYMDSGAAYQVGSQYAQRLTTSSENKTSLNFAIAMTAAKAKQAADVLMYDAWTSRTSFAFQTGWKYSYLEPTDVIQITKGGRTYTARITDEDYALTSARMAVLEDTTVYTQSAAAAALPTPGETVSGVPLTDLMLLDIPLLRDQDDGAGYYAAACGYGDGWSGAQAFKSNDGGATWTSFGNGFLNEATIGAASSALGDFTQNIFDESGSVTVVLLNGELASDTELNVLNGANVALLGDEIIQFKNATLIAANTYTLTGLLRGRRGTEWARASHAIGDRFVLLNESTTYLFTGTSSEYDAARKYRGVSFGGFLDDATDIDFTNTAVARECYAPVHLGGGRNAALDVILNWVRRTRLSGGWNDYSDVPLGEAAESYEVEIWDSGYSTLKRTIAGLSAQTTTYTAAQQITDFGSEQATVYWKAFQLSATRGRGYEAQGAT